MKLSEKTIELNFCAQLERIIGRPLLWFGLTQKQEARAGFDSAIQSGGRLFLFQIKYSNYVLQSGYRRFKAPHHQLIALQNRVKITRSVFYIFPMIGTTHELTSNPNIISNTWCLDVSILPNTIQPPTIGNTYQPRLSGIHYMDVLPPYISIHSEKINLKVENLGQNLKSIIEESEGIQNLIKDNSNAYKELSGLFRRLAVGVIVN